MIFGSKRPLLVATAAITALAAVACGSSGSHTSATTSGAPASSTGSTGSSGSSGATGAPIKVGLQCTCSGAFGANTAPVAEVYKAWVQSVNASGGINGHKIDLITEDDGGNPGTATSQVQQLINDKVDAIADMSLVDQPWAPTVEQANIPVVGIDQINAPFYTNPAFYPEGQTNNSVTYSLAAAAKDAGATSLGIVYCTESASCAQSVPLVKTASKQLGLTVDYTGTISATQPSYAAQCLAAKQGGVKAFIVFDSAQTAVRVANDCNTQGFKPIYITEGLGYGDLFLQSSSAIGANLWNSFNDIPYFANAPVNQTMNAAVDKYYPGLRKNLQQWSELNAYAWYSGLMLEAAVKDGGLTPSDTPSSAEIIKGLTSFKGETLDGAAPPLTFAAGQPHPINCWFTSKTINHQASLANSGKTTCESGT